MRYEVYGPFPAPRVQSEANGEALGRFWKDIEAVYSGLSRAIGIYIFLPFTGKNTRRGTLARQMRKQVFVAKCSRLISSIITSTPVNARGGRQSFI